MPDDVSRGDDVGVQQIVRRGDDGRSDEVGAHQATEADAASQRGDDLRLVGQLRGEEDDGNEGEKRAENADEVALDKGYITIVPVKFDITAYEYIDQLSQQFKK